jgi:hypothetical protein
MDFTKMIGLGVAGNFTDHLEQAGEARDFVAIPVEDMHAPKGVFPFYLPSQTGRFIEEYPLSSTLIYLPSQGGNVQIEPEVALICDITYEENRIVGLTPLHFSAFNDCSIRRPDAKKISEKKNWGPNSKGVSLQTIAIDHFAPGGVIDDYRIACYLLREGRLEPYGVDSEVKGYSYFYQQLLDWIVEKMNTQREQGPLESIPALLEVADHPQQAIISIGATRYTSFGESTFLQTGDELFVVLYNGEEYDSKTIERLLKQHSFPTEGISVLHQRVA